ncbi:MAG: hypothetical protein AAF206_30135, partial [Bacteroidota bacterium]
TACIEVSLFSGESSQEQVNEKCANKRTLVADIVAVLEAASFRHIKDSSRILGRPNVTYCDTGWFRTDTIHLESDLSFLCEGEEISLGKFLVWKDLISDSYTYDACGRLIIYQRLQSLRWPENWKHHFMYQGPELTGIFTTNPSEWRPKDTSWVHKHATQGDTLQVWRLTEKEEAVRFIYVPISRH